MEVKVQTGEEMEACNAGLFAQWSGNYVAWSNSYYMDFKTGLGLY